MKIDLDRIENTGKLVPTQVMESAINLAKVSLDSWTDDELRCYAFDRLVDEVCMQLLGECDE